MKEFPSIDQFRQIVREVRSHHDFETKDANGDAVYNHRSPYPTIEFKGTVKLHGTNAGIVKYHDRIDFQSRSQVLSIGNDNSGFYNEMSKKDLTALFQNIYFKDYVAIFGEWCGQGIQSGVAISSLPKMFVIFACKIDDAWVDPSFLKDKDGSQNIFNINQFDTFRELVDFNKPELSQNKFIEITSGVEARCPVGLHFGIEGIGEGVVWKASHNNHFYQFKVKGEKHSVSKVKTLASVDVEMVNSINEFIDNVVTEQRLEQGFNWLSENSKELSAKSTGDFLRWVVTDILKEESDTIVENNLDTKKVNPAISVKARLWFFNRLNQKEFVS